MLGVGAPFKWQLARLGWLGGGGGNGSPTRGQDPVSSHFLLLSRGLRPGPEGPSPSAVSAPSSSGAPAPRTHFAWCCCWFPHLVHRPVPRAPRRWTGSRGDKRPPRPPREPQLGRRSVAAAVPQPPCPPPKAPGPARHLLPSPPEPGRLRAGPIGQKLPRPRAAEPDPAPQPRPGSGGHSPAPATDLRVPFRPRGSPPHKGPSAARAAGRSRPAPSALPGPGFSVRRSLGPGSGGGGRQREGAPQLWLAGPKAQLLRFHFPLHENALDGR